MLELGEGRRSPGEQVRLESLAEAGERLGHPDVRTEKSPMNPRWKLTEYMPVSRVHLVRKGGKILLLYVVE